MSEVDEMEVRSEASVSVGSEPEIGEFDVEVSLGVGASLVPSTNLSPSPTGEPGVVGTAPTTDQMLGQLLRKMESQGKECREGMKGMSDRLEEQIEGMEKNSERASRELKNKIDGLENKMSNEMGQMKSGMENKMESQGKEWREGLKDMSDQIKGLKREMAIVVSVQVNVECPQVSGEGNLECESCNGECFPHSGLVVYRDRVDVTTPQPGDEFGIVQHQGGGAEQEGVEFLGVHAMEPDQVFIGDIDQSLAGPGMICGNDEDEDDLIQRLETCDSPMEVELVQAQRSLGDEVSWSEEVVGMTEGTLTVHCYLETEAPKLDNQLGECVGSGLDLDLGGSGDRASGDLVPVGNLDQLQGGAEQPVVEVVPCSCGLAVGMKICKIKLQWGIDLEQPWWGLVPGLRDLDMGRSWVMASGKSCPFQNLGMPASWGAVMARFGRGVQPWVSRYDLGPTGGLVECGVPCPSGRRPSWWLGPAGSLDPGGG
uniref:uncharacterized protein n=1 Tax=Myxine glutinosa TaxID=7769 RepID=UPI003590224E